MTDRPDARPDNWIWLDLETTCLDERTPADAHILEIGLIAVDARLNEVAHWGSAIKFPRGDLADVLRRCGTFELHQNSGLYGELTGPRAIREFAAGGLPTLAEAEAVACQFVQTFAPPVMQPRRDGQGEYMAAGSPLCGSNVGKFDWPWIREQMPKLAAMFHYRAYDSNFCFMSEQRFGGGPSVKAETRHRALDDCRQSIDTVRRFFGLPTLSAGATR